MIYFDPKSPGTSPNSLRLAVFSVPSGKHEEMWQERGLGKTGKSVSRRAASHIRSPRWCQDYRCFTPGLCGAAGGMNPL
jgi:hypothetical protein